LNITFTLDLSGGKYLPVTKSTIQKNIDALQRAIDGKPLGCDDITLYGTKSILEGIQEQLP